MPTGSATPEHRARPLQRCTEEISEWRATGGVEGRKKGVTWSLEVLALPRIGCDNADGPACDYLHSEYSNYHPTSPNSLPFACVGMDLIFIR